MNVYHNTDQIPAFRKAVITIGTFDGVHLGHCQILEQLKSEAMAIGGETVVVTFDPHPRQVISNKPLQLLTTLSEKIFLLERAGIHNLVVVPFTAAFASLPAAQYVEDFLIGQFHPHTVIIGYDHHFGKGKSGDIRLLESYAQQHAFRLVEIPVHVIDEAAISSTRIREAIRHGRVEEAAQWLGYNYFFEGMVVEGNKLGRTIGYPTANLHVSAADKLIPGNGVYAVEAEIVSAGAKAAPAIKGMMNIGIRPTINGINRVIEVHLFNFNSDIYGATLRVHLKRFLRAEVKFNGLDELKAQLAKDKLEASR